MQHDGHASREPCQAQGKTRLQRLQRQAHPLQRHQRPTLLQLPGIGGHLRGVAFT